VSEEAAERLQAMEETTDGFALAEKDLQMRGPGEFLGTRQSGFPELTMAPLADTRLLQQVRAVAERIIAEDAALEAPEHRGMKVRVESFWQTEGDLS
jgi:ATP-dependent DNA helicase RecG